MDDKNSEKNSEHAHITLVQVVDLDCSTVSSFHLPSGALYFVTQFVANLIFKQ